MIVLSEHSDRLPPSSSVADLQAGTEAAKLAGCRVFYIPQDFDECGHAENALWHVPKLDAGEIGFWIGYIPPLPRYRDVYDAALVRNIALINDPDAHARAMEFDRAYPLIEDLTPKSLILERVVDCRRAAEALGFPIFVKGTVQSRKSRGWKACVAQNLEELERLVGQLLTLEQRTRGRVIARKLARLRHERSSSGDFPLGREFRVFVHREEVIGLGYYWEGEDSLSVLSSDERARVEALAVEVGRRLRVPFLAVDIGQQEDGRWIVIEVGDGQFAGLSQVPRLELWNRISRISVDSERC